MWKNVPPVCLHHGVVSKCEYGGEEDGGRVTVRVTMAVLVSQQENGDSRSVMGTARAIQRQQARYDFVKSDTTEQFGGAGRAIDVIQMFLPCDIYTVLRRYNQSTKSYGCFRNCNQSLLKWVSTVVWLRCVSLWQLQTPDSRDIIPLSLKDEVLSQTRFIQLSWVQLFWVIWRLVWA